MNKLNPDISYELAAKIGIFLISKGLHSWDSWSGKMLKKDQMEAFGVYFGKGTIHVDGLEESITSIVSCCFGTDYMTSCRVNCKEFSWIDNNMKGPLVRQLGAS